MRSRVRQLIVIEWWPVGMTMTTTAASLIVTLETNTEMTTRSRAEVDGASGRTAVGTDETLSGKWIDEPFFRELREEARVGLQTIVEETSADEAIVGDGGILDSHGKHNRATFLHKREDKGQVVRSAQEGERKRRVNQWYVQRRRYEPNSYIRCSIEPSTGEECTSV